MSKKRWYWVAVNKHAVACSEFPWDSTVVVNPTPQMIIGYETAEEAVEKARFMVSAPLKEVHNYFLSLRKLLPTGKINIKTFSDPEEPQPMTTWSNK